MSPHTGCSSYRSCSSCASASTYMACGWCAETSQCVSGSPSGPNYPSTCSANSQWSGVEWRGHAHRTRPSPDHAHMEVKIVACELMASSRFVCGRLQAGAINPMLARHVESSVRCDRVAVSIARLTADVDGEIPERDISPASLPFYGVDSVLSCLADSCFASTCGVCPACRCASTSSCMLGTPSGPSSSAQYCSSSNWYYTSWQCPATTGQRTTPTREAQTSSAVEAVAVEEPRD
jgi:hypothetical protein